jgi:hypothetical protein
MLAILNRLTQQEGTMTGAAFDTDGVFGEDWVYFFAELLDSNSDHEADFIWPLLELDPRMEVLDLAADMAGSPTTWPSVAAG